MNTQDTLEKNGDIRKQANTLVWWVQHANSTEEAVDHVERAITTAIEEARASERKLLNGVWAYHGTNKTNARKIIEQGFTVGTHFAHHLEEALELGGSWVFRIKMEDKPINWQWLNKEHIPTERIDRLTHFRPVVHIGTQPHLTRKVDDAEESRNLTGVPLT